jgi:hypothetical protein
VSTARTISTGIEFVASTATRRASLAIFGVKIVAGVGAKFAHNSAHIGKFANLGGIALNQAHEHFAGINTTPALFNALFHVVFSHRIGDTIFAIVQTTLTNVYTGLERTLRYCQAITVPSFQCRLRPV